jgi:stearoyl-CoA desaturase (delta-9 desaturase)
MSTAQKLQTADEQHISYNWPVMVWIGLMHVAALAAPFFFTWEALVVALVFHWITGGVGVCLGFHRLLTHGSFKTYRPVKLGLAFIGGLAGEGCALDWVATHRKHHALSDQEGDPHSPRDGAWWSHTWWLSRSMYGKSWGPYIQRWVPDLAKDPAMKWLAYAAIPSHFALGLTMFGIGYAIDGAFLGWSLVFWGMFVRLVLVLHSTWFVNSASHMWGYRNYETTDDSRNNWWVALVTYGEGWHNNHHAYPRMANHGHKWWEIDVTFRTIRLMETLGLAWDVVDYRKRGEKDVADVQPA